MSRRIVLSDDGTLDTVLRCMECGKEFRGTFDPPSYSDDEGLDRLTGEAYEEYVQYFIADVEEEHECGGSDD